MRTYYKVLEQAIRAAIEEKAGPIKAKEEDPEAEMIDCSSNRFSDALFVVKRHFYETGICQAHVMDTDEFDLRWRDFFADYDNYPSTHAKAPRRQIRAANQILVQSMYGAEVSFGMKPKDFDPYLAITLMDCIANTPDSTPWNRRNLTEVLERAFEIYPTLEMQEKMEADLKKGTPSPVSKI